MSPRTHLLSDDDVVYIHPSDINNAMLCGKRVLLQHEEGSVPVFGEALTFGLMLHIQCNDVAMGNHTLTGVKTKGYLEKRFVDLLENDLEVPLNTVTVQEMNVLFEELRFAVNAWSNDFLKVYDKLLDNVVAAEETLEVELGVLRDGRTLKLRGTPDLVTTMKILDWKSSGRPWKPMKAQMGNQPALYRHLVRNNYDIDPTQFVYAVYARNKGQWDVLLTDRNEEQIAATLNTVKDYAEAIYSGILPATPIAQGSFPPKRGWYCSAKWCDQWNICSDKYLADDVDESEVKEIRWK